MSKIRQRRRRAFPDGQVWVRTYPVTFLHDKIDADHCHDWHQLTFAVRGHLELVTADARRIVPSDRAVWVPAGTVHTEIMRAPISMRSLFIAPGAAGDALTSRGDRCRTIAVTPLLRELVLHISRLGKLDRRIPAQACMVGLLFDLLGSAEDIPLELHSPRDPRARRFAELVTHAPGDATPMAELARRAGASLRTLERCFQDETGASIGDWRRRVRLFHALRLLESGSSVTEVALEIGYATTSAFSAAFSRQFGHSPTGRRHAQHTHMSA